MRIHRVQQLDVALPKRQLLPDATRSVLHDIDVIISVTDRLARGTI
jgi:hypothetical protein